MDLSIRITCPRPYKVASDQSQAMTFNLLYILDTQPLLLECGWRLQWGRIMPPARPIGKGTRAGYLNMAAIGLPIQRGVYEAIKGQGWWADITDLPALKSFGSAMVDCVLDENVLERQGIKV